MKNFIGLNISYICKKENLTQKDFAHRIGIKAVNVNSYIKANVLPKIDTIQQICTEFGYSLDQFINYKLSEIDDKATAQGYPSMSEAIQMQANESAGIYGEGELVETLREVIEAKNIIIKMLKKEISQLKGHDNRSKTA